jgi:hypothetical protein
MKTITVPAFLAALILFLPATADAASIGASFLGDSGTSYDTSNFEPWTLWPTNAAGVVVQTNWNNIYCYNWGNLPTPPANAVATSGPLLDDAGNFTAVQLIFSANDAWNSDGTDLDTPNDDLMKGILKEGYAVGATMTLIFTNLAAGAYDVYVYGAVNSGPAELYVSVGGTTNYWTEPAAFEDVPDGGAGFIQAASTDPNNPAAGNYVLFTGVTAVSGTITITATYDDQSGGGSGELGIAGLQLVTSGSFTPNTIPVAIVGQPGPELAAPGSTATFLVWATGPFASYQWFKNGALIFGATSSGYTTPPVSLSDNGEKYKVTVNNNVNSVTSDEAVLTVTNDPGTRVASIGANFLGSASVPTEVLQWQLAPTDSAGVVPQDDWNNINFGGGNLGNTNGNLPASGFVGISEPLLGSAGGLTAVQIQVNCDDAWNADGPTNTPNDKLMKGVFKQDSGSMTLTFTNLVPAFYDVYVYGDVDTGPENLAASVGTTTNYWTEPGAYDDGTGFILAASSDPNNPAAGNYVVFTGVTPASGTITVTATVISGPTGLGIAGVQIFSSAAFPTNTIPVFITAPPQNVVVAVGDSNVVMSVAVTGPVLGMQWYKNGAAISGATNLAYNLPPITAGDNGARFYAVLSNNVNMVQSAPGVVTVSKAVQVPGIDEKLWYGATKAEVEAGTYDTTPPDIHVVLSSFSTDNQGAYGATWAERVSCLFKPPVTTNYVFFITSDDDSDLLLSTNSSPANEVMIAQEADWSGPLTWVSNDGGTNYSELTQKRSDQFVDPVTGITPYPNGAPLTAGSSYYLEAIHEQLGGGANLDVTFKFFGESDPQDGDPTRITTSTLAPYAVVVQAVVGITVSGTNAIISWSPPGGTLQTTSRLLPAGAAWSNVGTANPTVLPIGAGPGWFRVQQF